MENDYDNKNYKNNKCRHHNTHHNNNSAPPLPITTTTNTLVDELTSMFMQRWFKDLYWTFKMMIIIRSPLSPPHRLLVLIIMGKHRKTQNGKYMFILFYFSSFVFLLSFLMYNFFQRFLVMFCVSPQKTVCLLTDFWFLLRTFQRKQTHKTIEFKLNWVSYPSCSQNI